MWATGDFVGQFDLKWPGLVGTKRAREPLFSELFTFHSSRMRVEDRYSLRGMVLARPGKFLVHQFDSTSGKRLLSKQICFCRRPAKLALSNSGVN